MFQMRWFVCGFTFLDVSFTLSKGACSSQVLVIVVVDDVETDVESCGLGWMLSTLLSLVFCGALY